MSEYAQRFAENRIDVSVLPELTDLDLEKIGVVRWADALTEPKSRNDLRSRGRECSAMA
jgi:hypothetical protein